MFEKSQLKNIGRSAKTGAEIAACTIVSKNYIAFARTLADSFHRFHPDAPFYVLLVDRIDGRFDPRQEKFELIEISELPIEEFAWFSFKYSIVELNTAVKPYFLTHLFARYGLKKILYFDPDILITEKLSKLFEVLDSSSVVLIPHTTAPIQDNCNPSELDLLLAGVYNLGFIGLAATQTTQQLLDWWARRVYNHCLMAPHIGMHVDQKWIDLVPCLFEGVSILRDPGYDVAYWNLHSRTVNARNGKYFVNGEPCYFFHFSGFDPTDPSNISKHQNRFTMPQIGDAMGLFKSYSDLVLQQDYSAIRSWPYAFGFFNNGAAIPDVARRMYYHLGAKQKDFPNPFATSSSPAFFDWLNEPVDSARSSNYIVTRLWYELFHLRADVQKVFPDVLGKDREGFVHWIHSSGRKEHGIDPRLVPEKPSIDSVGAQPPQRNWRPYVYGTIVRPLELALKPKLKSTIGRNRKAWNKLKQMREFLSDGQPVPITVVRKNPVERLAPAAEPLPFGVNLIGYFSSEKGVGEAGRASIRALEAAALPYALTNVVDSGSANIQCEDDRFVQENPFRVNLFHVNADQVPIVAEAKGRDFFAGRYNIGCWFWELSQFPEQWIPSFAPFDEIWASTSFIQDALARVSPIPVVKMPLAVMPEPKIMQSIDRSHFGLPSDTCVFLTIFDLASVLQRKNPLGVIESFKMAFGPRDSATLILKTVHSDQHPEEYQILQQACAGINAHIIDGVISREEMNALVNLCDCYVSLHRSEGFGLTIAEAMTLGKPAIVTAYSGNMDFTTPSNSLLVKYRLVEIDRDYGPYRKGWTWAEPDLEHAAEQLGAVFSDTQLRETVGLAAKREIFQLLHPQVAAVQMKARLQRVTGLLNSRRDC